VVTICDFRQGFDTHGFGKNEYGDAGDRVNTRAWTTTPLRHSLYSLPIRAGNIRRKLANMNMRSLQASERAERLKFNNFLLQHKLHLRQISLF
jgi:hypothetical protein